MNKIFLKKIIPAIFVFFAIFFNFSCKSTAGLEKVNPIDLLEPDSTVYFSIPVQKNYEFSKALVESMANDKASQKDIEKILKKIDMFYVSVDMKTSQIEMSASGDFPVTLSKLVLTEKNGWKKQKFNSYNYYDSKSAGISLSMITSDIACITSTSDLMKKELTRYDGILSDSDIEKVDFSISDTDICFFFPDAKDAMSLFFGGFSLGGIKSVSGKFVQVPNSRNFNMNIDLNISDSRMKRAISGLLSLALIGSGASVDSSSSEDIISVSGILMTWDDLLSLAQSSGAN